MKIITAIFLFLTITSTSHAESGYAECFQKLQVPFKSWNELFAFREKGECLWGAVCAEIWADHVTLLLADHWELLPQLNSIAPRESNKRDFVLNSIDVTCPFYRCEEIVVHQGLMNYVVRSVSELMRLSSSASPNNLIQQKQGRSFIPVLKCRIALFSCDLTVGRPAILTFSIMWINIAIKSHIMEVRYEDNSNDS